MGTLIKTPNDATTESLGTPTQRIPPSIFSDCKICQIIWRVFTSPSSTDIVELGHSADEEFFQCPRHQILLKNARPDQREVSGYIFIKKSIEMSVTLGDYTDTWLGIDNFLVKQATVPQHSGNGCILDPEWVDVDKANQWKDMCLSLHGPRCHNPMRIPPTQPAWLIDTDRYCIVPGESCTLSNGKPANFIALSYRWGKGEGFQANVDNVEMIKEPDSLKSLLSSGQLPPMIDHAIHLTTALGERYLWVDALCIIHGNISETASQLNSMGAIYASTVVTIAALDEDAWGGFPGLKGVSPPRNVEQTVIQFGDETIIQRNVNLVLLQMSEYHKRGWTYQEYEMAPRKLIFRERELHWQCQCSLWHEDIVPGADLAEEISQDFATVLSGFPDTNSLSKILDSYNRRELKYEEDALPAISGILSLFSRTFRGGFLYGLPEFFFDQALGWRGRNVRRRAPSERLQASRLSDVGLPSWSWIGWQGHIDVASKESPSIDIWNLVTQETFPITRWYTSTSPNPDSTGLRRIQSTWFDQRDAFKDFTKTLAPGWTRHEGRPFEPKNDEPYIHPDGCGDFFFTHCNSSKPWHYPFPIMEIRESTPIFMPEQTPYLFCNTHTACLWVRETWFYPEIYNEFGSLVGILDDGVNKGFPDPVSVPGRPVHLVAISRFKEYQKHRNDQSNKFDSLETLEYYRVLWVEWKEGIAYRLGCGRVEKEEWEKLDLKEVSLVLG